MRSKIDLTPEMRSEVSGIFSSALISALAGLPKDNRDRAQIIAPAMGEIEVWDDIECE